MNIHTLLTNNHIIQTLVKIYKYVSYIIEFQISQMNSMNMNNILIWTEFLSKFFEKTMLMIFKKLYLTFIKYVYQNH